jgi:hypothetical protein
MAGQKPKYKGADFTTPIGRASFPALMTPKLKYQSKTDYEYSVDLLFEEDTDFSQFNKAVNDALVEVFGIDKKTWPKNMSMPLIDQEVLIEKAEEKGKPIDHLQAGAMYARFKTNAKQGKPLIVDKNRKEVLDEALVYGGVYGRVSGKIKINVIDGTDPQTKKKIQTVYVTPYLSGFQIVRDGEAFGGGKRSAEDMFDAANFDDEDDSAKGMM